MLPHVNLRRLREAKGWTQAQAACAAGVTLRRYQAWETGRTELRITALEQLADAFGLSVGELATELIEGKPKRKR